MKFDKDEKGLVDISFRVGGDGIYSILKILRHFQYNGNIGHSYSVILDPDVSKESGRMSVGWDGDGSDRVKDIKVNGSLLDEEQFDEDHMNLTNREARIAERIVKAAEEKDNGYQ